MKAVIAEKPSVAREIGVLLGAVEKKDGFLIGNGYCVTWALGHLVALGLPSDYGISGFKPSSLPILPNPFILTVRRVRKDKDYIDDAGAMKQLKIIEHVFNQCESIIVATDAGREGELIFRYIYEYLNCSKPFQRLWINSLTEKAIRQGFDNLLPGSDFNLLYWSGRARSQADWLVGINASQALSIATGGTYSLGRVQTPTLKLICKRYLENKEFSIKKYWQIELEHRKEFIDFKSLSNTKWEDRKSADDVLKSIQRSGQALVSSTEAKTITEQPPLLYDLTGLQKEANRQLGFSAEETLSIAQSLYEKKFISYPRTGSKYIPEDVWAEVPKLLRALDARHSCRGATAKIKWGGFNKRIVNNLKVTDHHGLLITDKIPSALSAKENSIYDMIALRLLEAVSQACTKEITKITLEVLHYEFAAKGCAIIEPGWRTIRGNFSDDENYSGTALPKLIKEDVLRVKSAEIQEKKTSPPPLYTEADLLSAMENAGRDLTEEENRKIMQGIGIGTPATRAAIIETLFSRDYIRRVKKNLIPTEKGLTVYQLVKDRGIADVGMTAQWEIALHDIENGQRTHSSFLEEMEIYAGSITKDLLSTVVYNESISELMCPKCKKHILEFKEKIVKCPDEGCRWIQYKMICGVQLKASDITMLLQNGRTPLIKGMKSRSGRQFDAFLVIDDHAAVSFEFPAKK